MMDSYLSTALGVAAVLLAMAVLVQITEEIYKYLTSTKSKAYKAALFDFLGARARVLFDHAAFGVTRVRGPFSFNRVFGRVNIQAMNAEEIQRMLVKSLPPWVQLALERLDVEQMIQDGKAAAASPQWNEFLKTLNVDHSKAPGGYVAEQIKALVDSWQEHQTNDGKQLLDARAMREHILATFAPFVRDSQRDHASFEKNFEYTYSRKIYRQTLTIAVLVCLFFNMRIDHVMSYASKADEDALLQFAASVQKEYTTVVDTSAASPLERDFNSDKETLERYHALLASQPDMIGPDSTNIVFGIARQVTQTASSENVSFVDYCYSLLFCLISALLVSAGAPVWNDIITALIGIKKTAGMKKAKGE